MVLPHDAETTILVGLCRLYLREPENYWVDEATGPSATWNPPLTSAEQATLADLRRMAHFGLTSSLTLAEFQAMKPSLADVRSVKAAIVPLRTRTAAQWSALTATQREADQLTYLNALADGLNDVVNVLEALLRDA